MTQWPNQGAAANSRPALRFTMLDNLNICFASDAPCPAVVELGRSAGETRMEMYCFEDMRREVERVCDQHPDRFKPER